MRFPSLNWRRIAVFVLIALLIAIVAFVIWATNVPGQLMPEVSLALQSDQSITVAEDSWISFMPQAGEVDTGYIIYPGGRVLAEAYAPLARSIAEDGYFVAIVYAPLNLALFNPGAALPIIEAHPEIQYWAVGGHSLGGVAASSFASSNPQQVDGLVLMASVPFPSLGLGDRENLSVVSIYGSNDGLLPVDEAQAAASELPASAQFVEIEGGNHAYFGWYGPQGGDNEATISREEQQEQIVSATIDLLASLKE